MAKADILISFKCQVVAARESTGARSGPWIQREHQPAGTHHVRMERGWLLRDCLPHVLQVPKRLPQAPETQAARGLLEGSQIWLHLWWVKVVKF